MTRTQILLSGLAAVLVLVLFWLLLYSPRSEELAEIRAETEDIEARQVQTAQRIANLEDVRDTAPAQEAALAAAQSIIPRDQALPSFLRQLQLAADESGMVLSSVSPSRPTAAEIEGGASGLHRINVVAALEGSYFQLVDLLRRIEDPEITPRSVLWNSVSVGGDPEDHPELQVSLQGDLYALLPTASAPEPEAQDEDEADVEAEADEDDTGPDAEVEE